MNENVKDFIKRYQKEIEEDNWDAVLASLINSRYSGDVFLVQTVLETLYNAGIDFYSKYLEKLNTKDPKKFFKIIGTLADINYDNEIVTLRQLRQLGLFSEGLIDLAKLALRFNFNVYLWTKSNLKDNYIIAPQNSSKIALYNYINDLKQEFGDKVAGSDFKKISTIK